MAAAKSSGEIPPPPAQGYTRKWLRCRTCQAVYFYDFVPYSLSNPVTWTPCGHSLGYGRDLNCDEVTEAVALAALLGRAKTYEVTVVIEVKRRTGNSSTLVEKNEWSVVKVPQEGTAMDMAAAAFKAAQQAITKRSSK